MTQSRSTVRRRRPTRLSRRALSAGVASLIGVIVLAAGASAYTLAPSRSDDGAVRAAATLTPPTPSHRPGRHHATRPVTPSATTTVAPAPSPSMSATTSYSPTTTPAGGSPAVTPTPSASPDPLSKPYKGVANSSCSDMDRLSVSWFYNWTTTTDCPGHGFVPMVAGKSEKTEAAVRSAIDRIAQAGYRSVLGFNEPNKADQANLSVQQVVSMWPALSSNPAVAVGSPATSADTAGQAWFSSFMDQVAAKNLRVDFIAVHWYGWNAGSCDASASQLESYLNWVQSKAGGRPIWITEWGCMNQSNPSQTSVSAFYQGAVKMLARHQQVERYAWYPWNTNNNLVAGDGTLTEIGKAFAQARSTS
ncbi:hypothetical protein GCM10022223_63180 [Kineosporia mesophila]|uniref:Asl1-like glycosyl hydrolase catalytic domain-containing protein n=1 Tax=Kineosporia mesophila TaxID=566012 RepID=A0ABP7AMZ4_9ACTN|nr:glycosyl hydrolase [Kineosporia mesophila]MCD5354583.1 glycosyl hydrolase [Kineosporia mesophila]